MRFASGLRHYRRSPIFGDRLWLRPGGNERQRISPAIFTPSD